MEGKLPEDEPGSIQWEGGEEHKGDDETSRDPKTATVIDNIEDETLAAEDQSHADS